MMEFELDPTQPPLAWEDPAFPEGKAAQARATFKTLLGSPEEAGAALGKPAPLGKAVGFFALFGLPCQWLAALVVHLSTVARPDRLDWLLAWFHLPKPAAPSPQQVAFQQILGWGQVAIHPLLAALGILILGALAHVGLWMVRGLARDKGIDTTYRTLLYLGGALSWIGLVNSAGAFLPGGYFWLHQAFSLALALGVISYQGMVLAEVHGVERWRGVLGVFLPGLLLCLVCACCLALVGLGAAGLASGRV